MNDKTRYPMLDVETIHSQAVVEVEPAGERRFTVALCLVFAAVLAVGLFTHEVWRDEARAWLIALESDSIPALLDNLRGERHPAAWYFLLMAVAHFTASVAAMQALHFVIATAVVLVVGRYAPFPRWQRVLLVFGYFFLYEYAVISRGYSLGSLALFGACALLPARRRSYLPFAALLALLANTSVYGAMLAVAFTVGLAVDAWLERANGGTLGRRHAWPALVILGFGLMASALLVRQGSDLGLRGVHRITGGYSSAEWEAAMALSAPARAYLPLPDFGSETFWNSSLFIDGTTPALLSAAALAVLLVLAFSALLARRPAALALYMTGTGAMVTFGMLFDVGSARHYGHHYLLLVAALWAAHHFRETEPPSWLSAGHRMLDGPVRVLFACILVVQAATAAMMYGTDLRLPFSTGRDAARYLETHDLDRTIIAGASHDPMTAIAVHLRRPLFYIDVAHESVFAHRIRKREEDVEAGLDSLRRKLGSGREALVVSARPLPDYLIDGAPGLSFEEVRRFDESMDTHERFVIFRARLR